MNTTGRDQVVSLGEETHKTQTVKGSLDPEWREAFDFAVTPSVTVDRKSVV